MTALRSTNRGKMIDRGDSNLLNGGNGIKTWAGKDFVSCNICLSVLNIAVAFVQKRSESLAGPSSAGLFVKHSTLLDVHALGLSANG